MVEPMPQPVKVDPPTVAWQNGDYRILKTRAGYRIEEFLTTYARGGRWVRMTTTTSALAQALLDGMKA